MLFPAVADIYVATQDASFGLPEIHRNMIPSIVSRELVEWLGKYTTRRLSLIRESFNVKQTLRMGLVDHLLGKKKMDQYIANMVRRWRLQVNATKFIKENLLPRTPSNSLAMGIVAGTWLMDQSSKDVIGNNQVL